MLTARQVATAKEGRYLDQKGLYLEVSPTGKKRWVLRYSRDKKVTEATLGSAEFVTLAQARDKAFEFRRDLANGTTTPKRVTFGEVAALVIASKRVHLDARGVQQLEASLRHCAPLSNRDVGQLGVSDVLGLVQPLWTSTPSTAKRLRAFMEQVFSAARVKGHRSDNPAQYRNFLDQILSKQPASEHHRAMPYAAAPSFMRALEREGGVVARAMRLIVLLALRKMEVVEMRWSEVQGDPSFAPGQAILTIPAGRIKMRREFRVPLSSGALAVLAEQRAMAQISDFVFPSPNGIGNALNGATFNKLLERLEVGETVHGFRTTFATWAQEKTSADPHVIDGCLAHVTGSATTRAYLRSDNLEQRCALMEQWAKFLLAP
jgi:integrase